MVLGKAHCGPCCEFADTSCCAFAHVLWAARLWNEAAPVCLYFDTKNGLKNVKKDSEKRSETSPKKCLKPLSGRLKVFHRHFSKSFSLLKICKQIN